VDINRDGVVNFADFMLFSDDATEILETP